ncbi:hypothetical protein SDC9_86546 [bioreactor metagenome]|uniref:Uncharacterized protein n=1 Tax=bioreactor metagenome TaxID=1076179 RepID=A0A644ZGD7_9ZZZZ
MRPQPQRIVHPIGQARLLGGLIQVLQRALHQRGIAGLLQIITLLRGQQVGAPRLIELQGRLHGRRARNGFFVQQRSRLCLQRCAKGLRCGLGGFPLRRAQQHYDLALHLFGQLLRCQRHIGCLLIQRQ